MKAVKMLELIKGYADKYRKEAQQSLKRNSHMNEIEGGELVQQRHIDAVLVDFINYIAYKHGIDYGLCTKDLTMTAKEFIKKEALGALLAEYDENGFLGIDERLLEQKLEEYHQAKLKLLGIYNGVEQSEQLECKFCGADKGLKHGYTPDGEPCPMMDKTA